MRPTPFLAALIAAASLGASPAVRAGDGHDHDHGDAAPVASGPALPRFAAVSETFELVGVVRGRQLTLYLDRTADNAPVVDARIELEIGGSKLEAEKHEDAYAATLPAEPAPGVLPITATVTAGNEVDLLAGELDIHPEAHAEEAVRAPGWKAYAGWAAGAIAALIAVTLAGRRRAAARRGRLGATA